MTPGRSARLSRGNAVETASKRHAAMTWAQRLKRVFRVDIETCRHCGGRVKVIASIEPDKWKEFKLISAAQFGSDETVFVLLAAGANPLLRDGFGQTARDYAKQKGRTEIARHLEIAERLWKQKSQSIKDNAA